VQQLMTSTSFRDSPRIHLRNEREELLVARWNGVPFNTAESDAHRVNLGNTVVFFGIPLLVSGIRKRLSPPSLPKA
jgi:hypothetical protein